eukprot:1331723-Pyramimonas_sp.AAC.1
MQHRYRGGNAPSSGFMAVFYSLQRCRNITLFGFSLDQCRSMSNIRRVSGVLSASLPLLAQEDP